MVKIYLIAIFFIPLFVVGQGSHSVDNIDNIVRMIDNDNTITKSLYDTVSYEKEDGGKNWDSSYHHK